MPSGKPGPGLGRVANRATPSESAAAPVETAASNGSSKAIRRLNMFLLPEECCPMESTSLHPKKSARCAVEPLETTPGDPDQLADLHPGLVVARHHVRLDHDRHVLLQGHLRQRPRGAAQAADNRREVAPAEAVH